MRHPFLEILGAKRREHLSATAQASASDWKYDWKTCRFMTPIERGDDAVTSSRAID